MTIFYQIETDKNTPGKWVVKRRDSNYKYVKVPKSPSHDNIEDAQKWIDELSPTPADYNTWTDHVIQGSSGHLISIEDWKLSCDQTAFIDYDGYGDPVNANYEFVGESVIPSDYTKNPNFKFPEGTKYILWYNR